MGVILILIHLDIILGSMQCEKGRSTIIVSKKLLRWAKLDVVGSAGDQQACICFRVNRGHTNGQLIFVFVAFDYKIATYGETTF